MSAIRGIGIKMRKTHTERHEKIVYITEIICDICGRKGITKYSAYPSTENAWYVKGEAFREHFTNIAMEDRTSYPDGGYATMIHFDVCPKCFKEKLIPWFESQGISYTESDKDW